MSFDLLLYSSSTMVSCQYEASIALRYIGVQKEYLLVVSSFQSFQAAVRRGGTNGILLSGQSSLFQPLLSASITRDRRFEPNIRKYNSALSLGVVIEN